MKRPSLASLGAWSLSVVLVAIVVHLSSVLLLPRLAADDAYAHFEALPAGEGFRPMDAGQSGLPFLDEAVLLAVCRFDLSRRPLRLRLEVDQESLTTVSFHARNGVVFHTLTDRAALRGRLDVLLGLPAQIEAAEAADADDAPVQEVRLTAPAAQGFILIRGLASSPSRTPALRRRMNDAECRSDGP